MGNVVEGPVGVQAEAFVGAVQSWLATKCTEAPGIRLSTS
jgi:hypothetical protein